MANQNDPISQIKKAEEDSKKKIEQSKRDFDEKIKKFTEELEEKTQEFENGLKERGTEKLENVKKEAGELFKSKIATSESQKNKLLSDAKGKQSEAVDETVDSFLNHIKA